VPTIATIIAEIVDEFGQIVSNAPPTTASLVVWNSRFATPYENLTSDGRIPWLVVNFQSLLENAAMITSTNGRFEWRNVQFDGFSSTTITLTVRTDIGNSYYSRYNPQTTLATCQCPVQVTLQGGFPFSASIPTQAVNLDSSLILYPGAKGPFAIPGVVAGTPPQGEVFTRAWGGYDGSVPKIVLGEKVRFPHTGKGSYPAIALLVRDRFGNAASFSTTVTLSLSGGTPPADQVRTPVLGNVAESVVTWGQGYLGQEYFTSASASLAQITSNVALFPDFTILGATTNQCSLVATVSSCGDPYLPGLEIVHPLRCFVCSFFARSQSILQKDAAELQCSPGNTSAIVSLMPSRAVALAPVIMAETLTTAISLTVCPRKWSSAQAILLTLEHGLRCRQWTSLETAWIEVPTPTTAERRVFPSFRRNKACPQAATAHFSLRLTPLLPSGKTRM
jgi:hypothetical protein